MTMNIAFCGTVVLQSLHGKQNPVTRWFASVAANRSWVVGGWFDAGKWLALSFWFSDFLYIYLKYY